MALAAVLSAAGQQGTFHPVAKEVVISRLRQAARDNLQREQTLKKLFEETGCAPERLEEQPVKHLKAPNVICSLPGATDSRILVSAHTDYVKAGDGTVDDWSGAALLASLLEGLRETPRRHTFVFIGFSGEEEGLVGSHFYVKSIRSGQPANISALVNIECLGLSPTAVWLSHADPQLATLARQASAGMHLPLQSINVEQVGRDDAESFVPLHIRGITFHSVTQETLSILHSPRDSFRAIRVDDYYDSYRLIAAYLALIDTTLL
ncbi:MAG: M28 family peptidase [Bryobacteraceae bacterium]